MYRPKGPAYKLLLSVVIAAGLWACSQYQQPVSEKSPAAHPKQIVAPPPKITAPAEPDFRRMPSLAATFTPPGWEVYDQVRELSPQNIYGLIDGGAELYLSYNMVSLLYIYFVNKVNPGQSIELFIYDMGSATNAFGIFSVERSRNVRLLRLGRDSYIIDAYCFIWKGRYYIRIIPSAIADELRRAAVGMAHAVTPLLDDSGEPVWGLSALPRTDMIPGTEKYFHSSAPGLAFMQNTYTAHYLKGGAEIPAFLSKQESPEAAQAMVARYIEHFRKNGSEGERISQNGIDLTVCDRGGMFTSIFQKGRLVGGVISASSRPLAAQAASDFYSRLREE